ncbi:MAG: hypothetical protein ACYDAJ_03280 [Nitrosotalea sp.]
MNLILKKSSFDARFIIKTALIYCILSMAFSFAGIFLAEKGPIPNPVGSLTVQEVTGHFAWGLVAGAVTLSLRHIILTGLFAVLIDSDHLIGLTHLDALVRMSHSISFGIISVIVLMALFGKRDYRLGAAAMAGLLSHLSFDTFAGDDGKFPMFTPFYNHQISFAHIDWLYFELAAVILIGVVTVIMKRNAIQKTAKI